MYDRSILESKTRAELREIATEEFGLKVKVKEVKTNLVNAIIQAQRSRPGTTAKTATSQAAPKSTGPLNTLSATLDSDKSGSRYTNTITVSCGAASGNYPVVGKKVSEVAVFLKEALNISVDSRPVVNGQEVSESYVLQNKDVLEFVATAGRKG